MEDSCHLPPFPHFPVNYCQWTLSVSLCDWEGETKQVQIWLISGHILRLGPRELTGFFTYFEREAVCVCFLLLHCSTLNCIVHCSTLFCTKRSRARVTIKGQCVLFQIFLRLKMFDFFSNSQNYRMNHILPDILLNPWKKF